MKRSQWGDFLSIKEIFHLENAQKNCQGKSRKAINRKLDLGYFEVDNLFKFGNELQI